MSNLPAATAAQFEVFEEPADGHAIEEDESRWEGDQFCRNARVRQSENSEYEEQTLQGSGDEVEERSTDGKDEAMHFVVKGLEPFTIFALHRMPVLVVVGKREADESKVSPGF